MGHPHHTISVRDHAKHLAWARGRCSSRDAVLCGSRNVGHLMSIISRQQGRNLGGCPVLVFFPARANFAGGPGLNMATRSATRSDADRLRHLKGPRKLHAPRSSYGTSRRLPLVNC